MPPPKYDRPADDYHATLLELLHCVARALREGARQRAVERGLLNVHWQVLWFLHAANRYSNTLQILAAYLGQAKGSVSQTVQLLERRGYVQRKPDSRDRRVTRLALTAEGMQLLAEIETDSAWDALTRTLPDAKVAEASAVLTALLRHWQQERGGATFGVCRSCSYFQVEAADRFRCGLTGESLNVFDSGQICGEHRIGRM